MTEVDCGPTATDVAGYLRRHPRFLVEFPDLALSLELPRDDGRTTSLASYQLDVLRDKNRELNRRMQELFATAQDNERLTVRTHQLSLALMRAGSPADVLRTMAASLLEDFHGERVRILLHADVPGVADAEWLLCLPRDAGSMAPFSEFLAAGEPLCGRLQPAKLQLLFGADADAVQSAALIALDGRGLLAIGSSDGSRFFPGMGTLFLRLMAEALVGALARYDGAR